MALPIDARISSIVGTELTQEVIPPLISLLDGLEGMQVRGKVSLFRALDVIKQAILQGSIGINQFDTIYSAVLAANEANEFYETHEVVAPLITRLKEYMDGYRAGEKAILSAVTY
ncbi:MAG: hypothetical protein A2804_00375 [Candidatus Pacebacteria bacterium RIFCSPHIGHO2_01_FULL_46_10]|nr:MAG: hypothetical protein A2804_00375 [Candidatus Pacebacteria bacterium RIFCSPHIGHO2_01_FULL_46_10]